MRDRIRGLLHENLPDIELPALALPVPDGRNNPPDDHALQATIYDDLVGQLSQLSGELRSCRERFEASRDLNQHSGFILLRELGKRMFHRLTGGWRRISSTRSALKQDANVR